MAFNFKGLYFEEKDFFILILGIFVFLSLAFSISLVPFRTSSLLVIFLFMVLTRSLISQLKFNSYFFICLTGLLFSLFLSPYGLAIYLFVAIVLYTKTNIL